MQVCQGVWSVLAGRSLLGSRGLKGGFRHRACEGAGFRLAAARVSAVLADPAHRDPLAGHALRPVGHGCLRGRLTSVPAAGTEIPAGQALTGVRTVVVPPSGQGAGGRSRWARLLRAVLAVPVPAGRPGRRIVTGRVTEMLNALGSTLPGNALVVGFVATALVWSSTHDAVQCAQIAASFTAFVGLLTPAVQGMIRRTAPARALSRYMSRVEPRSRLAFRGVLAARSALTCNNSLRDDVFALRKAMPPIMARHDVHALLGDNVQLGTASLMREVRLDGDRMVEAIFKLHGRDNGAWRDGWIAGDMHVVADGNSAQIHPVSMLLIVGEKTLVVKGKGIKIDEGASPPDKESLGLDKKEGGNAREQEDPRK